MAKKKNWEYTNTNNQKCGLMKCSKCGKKIENSAFRYAMTFDKWGDHTGFITDHRACTEDDPRWKKFDNEQIQHDQYLAAKLMACIEFKVKWGVDELDELINDLRS